MNAPAPLNNFPSISVLPHVTLVNGRMTENASLRGPQGPQGQAGVTTVITQPSGQGVGLGVL